MKADTVLAFRLARSGLVARSTDGLAAAAACPASDFARDAAMFALAARTDDVSADAYREAVESGDVVLAHVIRGAIHAVAPDDFALWGKALIATDDDELTAQIGQQFKRITTEHGIAANDALDEVAAATTDALKGGKTLSKDELHEELRQRVRAELMPWCKGCKSHHVAPMLWRYATVKAGVRLDGEHRYRAGKPGRAPAASEAVRRFLGWYGPSKPGDFTEWTGIARPHAQRLWDEVEPDLVEIGEGWLLAEDEDTLASPPDAEGLRFLPPGDPYLQKPNRDLLAPDPALRKRLFRPVASPGAVLRDGRLVGLWSAKAKGKKIEVSVEKLGQLKRTDLEDDAQRIAELRGAEEAVLRVD